MTPFKGTNRVTSLYGYRTLNGVRQFHYGIDVVRDSGTWDIREVTGGKVVATSTDYNGGRGWLVKVQTAPGVIEIYQHLSAISVKNGQTVKQGDKIGVAGATGYSFGVHLHFEVQVNGKAVEPSAWLGLPNRIGSYPGNDNLDVAPDPTPVTPPGPEPQPDPPYYPAAKYRLYNSIEAYSDKQAALNSFKSKKQSAMVEYVLCAIGDGKWRIAQVYLATEVLDNAIAQMGTDSILCGSDMSKYRLYNVISATESKDAAVAAFKPKAQAAPNEFVLATLGGDGKTRVGQVTAATESLEGAMARMTVDQILC